MGCSSYPVTPRHRLSTPRLYRPGRRFAFGPSNKLVRYDFIPQIKTTDAFINLPLRNHTQSLEPLPSPKLPAPRTPDEKLAARNAVVALSLSLGAWRADDIVGAGSGRAAAVGVDPVGVVTGVGGVVASAGEGLDGPDGAGQEGGGERGDGEERDEEEEGGEVHGCWVDGG